MWNEYKMNEYRRISGSHPKTSYSNNSSAVMRAACQNVGNRTFYRIAYGITFLAVAAVITLFIIT